MLTILDFWLPILLSGVAVFVVSSIIHMLLPYHRSNFSSLPDEASFRQATRDLSIPPNEYMVPYAGSPKAMQSEEYQKKLAEGPVAMISVFPNQPFAMGASLLQWFIYSCLVGVMVAYIMTQALTSETEYLVVLQLASSTAFLGYAFALIQNSIWYKRKWSTTFKFLFDGLVYSLLTGGIFAWQFPFEIVTQ